MVRVLTALAGTLAVVVALGAVSAGCGGGVNIAEIDAKAKSFNLTINNGSLQSDAEIVTGKALYSEQLMQAFVEIQSHTNDKQHLYYQFTWYDQDGAQMAETPTQILQLQGNQHKQVTGTAPGPRAEKCEFTLRHRSKDDHEN